MMAFRYFKTLAMVMLAIIMTAFAAFAQTGQQDELDTAVREAVNYLNGKIPKGNKIVILNVQSGSNDLSDYIISKRIENVINDDFFTVVDRQQLDAIQAEQQFQMSGAVDDKDALAIGKFFGAQTIVSGAVRSIGKGYNLSIRALDVQTAQVQAQFNKNIAASEILYSLLGGSGATIPKQKTVKELKDFTAGQRWGTWALNVVPGLGSVVIMKDYWGGGINAALGGVGITMFALDVNGDLSGDDGLYVFALVGAVLWVGGGSIWNIYRSASYHKPVSRSASAVSPENFGFAVLPDKDGNLKGYVVYSMGF